jgi:hypothetical protein
MGVNMPTKRHRTKLLPEQETEFLRWYADIAARMKALDPNNRGLNPNPDDPGHRYDYRGAWLAGFGPDPNNDMHWPSKFKDDDHPNRFVKLIDGQTLDSKYDIILNKLDPYQQFGPKGIVPHDQRSQQGRK